MKEADINKTAIISRLKAYRERNGARAYRIVAHYVGSKRISDDVLRAIVSNAYRISEVKVKMRPSSPLCNDNFAPKHRLIWEAVNGPIPKGHKLIFADGDKTNITLDNLLLITDAQMARLNQNHLIQPDKELTVAGLLVCDVISKTARRKEEMTRGKKHEKNC